MPPAHSFFTSSSSSSSSSSRCAMTSAYSTHHTCLHNTLTRFGPVLLILGYLFLCSAQLLVLAAPVAPDFHVSFHAVTNTNTTLPTPRCLHYTAPSDLTASFYVIAGRVSEPNEPQLSVLNDVWSFTASAGAPPFLPSGSWQLVQSQGSSPFLARSGLGGSSTTAIIAASDGSSKAVNTKTVVYLYGGIASNGQYLDDIWYYDTAPAANSPAWTQIRQPSSTRSPAIARALLTPHIVQPSARAFMSWQVLSVPSALLTAISHSVLSTQNLVDYLTTTATSGNTASVQVFQLFGGRSDPSNNYSTTWSVHGQPATTFTNTSVLNADYADLWWYIPSVDTWVRIGNLTCLNSTYTCTDYKYMNDVVKLATSSSNGNGDSLADQVTAITGNFTQPLRPDSLSAEVLALYNLVSALNDTLYDTLSYLMSVDPSFETNADNACAASCSSFVETPTPALITTAGCTLGVVSVSGGCAFYTGGRTQYGNYITQQRPNGTEGYASAVYTTTAISIGNSKTSTSNSTFSIYYQFGGFLCSNQHPGIDLLTRTDYDSNCFTNTLYVLDTTANNLVWWAINPPGTTSSSDQLLLWPAPRVYASMTIDNYYGQLWLYGGAALLGGQWQYYSDLHVMDVATARWLPLTIVGGGLSGRYGMSMFLSTLYSGINRLLLFGGCSGFNPTDSNTVYAIQTNWQIQATNWLVHGNTTTATYITAGQPSSIVVNAVVSLQQPTPLLFALGLTDLWTLQLTVLDNNGNSVALQPNSPGTNEIGNGVYTFNYTVFQGRTATLVLLYYEFAARAWVPLYVSPMTIIILPGAYSPHATTLLYSNYSVVAKLVPTSITLQLHDTWNNPCLSSQGAIPILLYYVPTSGQSPTTSPTTAPSAVNQTRITLDTIVIDNHDGTYTVTYTAPDLASYSLYVLVSTVAVPSGPFAVTALDPLDVPNSIQLALLVVSVVLGGVVFGMMCLLIWHRNNRVVRAGSPLFLVLICVGVIISVVSVPVYTYPSNVSCRLFPFLLTTGYILALAALFTKSYRVLLIFVRHQLHSMALTDSAMMGLVLILVSCETILNLVWLISDPLVLGTYRDTSVLTYRACGGDHAVAFISASVAFNGAIALWGVWLALQIRHVPEAFSESKLMGAALYNLALVMAITIPLTWTASNTQSSHGDLIIPAAAILWCSFATVALVIAPKLYYVWYPPPQHFFDGYPTSGVMVKGVKGRGNGHGPAATGADGKLHQQRSWSDERHEAAERAGFDVRRGGAPPAKKWRKHQEGQPVATRRPGEEETTAEKGGEVDEVREGNGEVEMRALKGSPSDQPHVPVAAVVSAVAAPAVMQPLMVEGAPAGFHGDNRRNSLSDRRRPAPIRTSVPLMPPVLPLLHHHSARTRSRQRGGSALASPRTTTQRAVGGKAAMDSTGSGGGYGGGGRDGEESAGVIRLHSPAVLTHKQSSASPSPPSSHSQLGTHYSPRQPSPRHPTPPASQSSPVSRSSHFRSTTGGEERRGGQVAS